MPNIDKIFDLIAKSSWKPFIISFIAIFFMVLLPKLGFRTTSFKIPALFYTLLDSNTYSKIINPQPHPQDNFDNIIPRLEQKPTSYQLKKPTNLIKEANASGDFQNAAAYGVVDFETGEVLAQKNLSTKLPIASLTKIMTAVIALDLMHPDEQITVSDYSTTMIPSKVFLQAGEKLTVQELMNCFLLSSANDCVQALVDGVDQKYNQPEYLGSDSIFIKAMNAKAKFLGLKESHFENPQGFDDQTQLSSVADLMVLSNYAIKNYPLIDQLISQTDDTLPTSKNHQEYYLNNWNGLLGVYPGVFGVKIGNTDAAGKTTVVVSQRQDKKVLAVVLGAPGIIERDLWASQLLDLGFEKLANLNPIDISEYDLRVKYATWKQ